MRHWIALGLALTVLLAACGDDDESSQEAAITGTVEDYLAAVAAGDGPTACALLTAEAQLGVFDFRLVHAGEDHPDRACARAMRHNRLEGEPSLEQASVTDVTVDGDEATATVDGVKIPLVNEGGLWRISEFGIAERVVPGERPPPKPRQTTLQ